MRATLSAWLKLATFAALMSIDSVNAFMMPPPTHALKNRQDTIRDFGQTTSKATRDDDIPFGIELTGGKKLYSEGYTGKKVKVAVIDSGIDETHLGFKEGAVSDGKQFEEGSLRYHGTHVAGTIQ